MLSLLSSRRELGDKYDGFAIHLTKKGFCVSTCSLCFGDNYTAIFAVDGASEKHCILTRDLQGQAVADVLSDSLC